MIKVVLWDVDGTLLDFQAAERAALKSCFQIFSLGECSDPMIAAYSGINQRYWEMLERGEMTKPEILTGRFKEFFRLYGLDSCLAAAFNDEYQLRLGDTICFFPHALDAVRTLKGQAIQCAVTNGTKIAQDRKLSKSGLDRLLDYIFISEVLGAEKPNKGFFDRVFAAIGDYAPQEAMIVGDSLTSDMRGGCNAGIRTCWFNSAHRANAEGIQIDFQIEDLSQVPRIVARSRR